MFGAVTGGHGRTGRDRRRQRQGRGPHGCDRHRRPLRRQGAAEQAWLSSGRGLNARGELLVSAITSAAVPFGNRSNAEGVGFAQSDQNRRGGKKLRRWRQLGSAALSPENCSLRTSDGAKCAELPKLYQQ